MYMCHHPLPIISPYVSYSESGKEVHLLLIQRFDNLCFEREKVGQSMHRELKEGRIEATNLGR